MSANVLGAIYMVIGSLGYVTNDALIRVATDEGLGVYQALCLRNIAMTGLFAAMLRGRRQRFSLRRVTRPLVGRVGAEVAATALFFAALINLEFANAQTVLLIVPFAVTLVAGTIGGETVPPSLYATVVAGFVGVLLVVQPGTGAFSPWSLVVVAAAACLTLREFATREVDDSTPVLVIALITAAAIAVMTGVLAAFTGWHSVTGRAVLVLAAACLCLVVGYLFTIQTVRVGDLSVSAPFRYTTLLGAVVLGFAFFDEVPNGLTLTGCIVIVLSRAGGHSPRTSPSDRGNGRARSRTWPPVASRYPRRRTWTTGLGCGRPSGSSPSLSRSPWTQPGAIPHRSAAAPDVSPRSQAACATAGMSRPLIVTDPGLVELPPVRTLVGLLNDAGIGHGLFSDLRPNPVGRDVDAGTEAFRAGGHDGVIAIGGGSALDVGKIVAFHAHQSEPIWAFEDGRETAEADASVIAPVVAVPTTAGTGSEVGRAGVVIDEDNRRKVIVFHPAMLPAVVIADPELTVGLPRVLTVGTGLDALAHSLEAICSPLHHPMSHGIGMEGCRLVLEHLPTAVEAPNDLTARSQMLTAAAMGAVAFLKGLGAIHALSHPVGAYFNTHHGMTNATLMPYVLLANRPAIESTIEQLAAYVGITGGFEGFVDHIVALRASLDVPHTLVDLGADPAAIDAIVADAVVDPTAATNPVPLDADLAASIFEAACTGRLG